MGKLQYVNRKISGPKLGGVVAKDLLKRITPGTTRSAALRDPSIELDVSGKGLDDEATVQITSALQAIYKNNGDKVIVRVEEICLARNMITANALKALSFIVRLSASHLRDLDLSWNKLSVVTETEQRSWETFLEALSHCADLRRLDLSGNDLGNKAFEMLAKAYARQSLSVSGTHGVSENEYPSIAQEECSKEGQFLFEVDQHLSESKYADSRDRVTQSGLSEQTRLSDEGTSRLADDGLHGLGLTKLKLDAKAVTVRQEQDSSHVGLNSIPYLIFDETGMDDACAMHLSFVIAEHELPLELLPFVPPARAGAPSQQLLEYDQDPRCRGIMYRRNGVISSDGWRVLELAELSRDKRDSWRRKREDRTSIVDPTLVSVETAAKRTSKDTSKSSALGMPGETGGMQRRYHDLGIARSKIQAEIIRQGSREIELWHVALQMLAVSRVILLSVAKRTRPIPRMAPTVKVQRSADQKWIGTHIMPVPRKETLAPLPALRDASTNISLTPRAQRLRADVELEATCRVDRLLGSCNGKEKALMYGLDKSQAAPVTDRHYRSNLLFGFSHQVWGKVLAYAVDTNEATTARQRRAIVQWASDRNTIRKELAELGKQRANQIWMVLNGMGCLEYE